MWIVRVALDRPYTFIVLAVLILVLSPVMILRTPTDIFPNIDIPVVAETCCIGSNPDGGYAEVMIAEARGIYSVPDNLKSAEAAPLLCAGITTCNALRNAGLRGEDLVAVQGVGDG